MTDQMTREQILRIAIAVIVMFTYVLIFTNCFIVKMIQFQNLQGIYDICTSGKEEI